jgi:hypothetical protein
VSVAADAAEHEGVIFRHAAREKRAGFGSAVLGHVEVFAQLPLGDVRYAVARLPADQLEDVFVDYIVVYGYGDGEVVHLLLGRERGRRVFGFSAACWAFFFVPEFVQNDEAVWGGAFNDRRGGSVPGRVARERGVATCFACVGGCGCFHDGMVGAFTRWRGIFLFLGAIYQC